MKKTLLIAAAALISASAIAEVTSANIVGYYKDTGAPSGGASSLHISGYQFTETNATPETVFGSQLPLGTKVSTYNGGYQFSTYEESVDYGTWPPTTNVGWSADLDLSGQAGFWVQNFDISQQVAVVAGEVELADSVTNSIEPGLQLVSYPYPVATTVTNLGLNAAVGDKVYVYDSGYQISTYEESVDYGTWPPTTNVGWSADYNIDVGEGFWVQSFQGVTNDWVVNRPFTP
jgi:hypothetical protein